MDKKVALESIFDNVKHSLRSVIDICENPQELSDTIKKLNDYMWDIPIDLTDSMKHITFRVELPSGTKDIRGVFKNEIENSLSIIAEDMYNNVYKNIGRD